MADVISDTLEAMTAQPAAQSLHLQGAIEESPPAVLIDSKRIQRVLYNLLQNSIRYTPSDGTILIQARCAGGEVEVAAAHAEHLFEAGYWPDQSRSRTSGVRVWV